MLEKVEKQLLFQIEQKNKLEERLKLYEKSKMSCHSDSKLLSNDYYEFHSERPGKANSITRSNELQKELRQSAPIIEYFTLDNLNSSMGSLKGSSEKKQVHYE